MKNKLKGLNLINKNKTHCIRGHKFTKENTYCTKQGWRSCKECKKIHDKKFWDKPKNKKKRKQYLKQWNKDNKEKQQIYHIKIYNKIRKIIEKAKYQPCLDCNVKYPYYVMDFHHTKNNKSLNVGLSRSIKRTIEEIKKCIVICSNCHRVRTWKNKKRKRV